MLNALNNFNLAGLALEVDISLLAPRVVRRLEQVIQCRGKPRAIRCCNDLPYVSSTLLACAERQGIALLYIQPVNPH